MNRPATAVNLFLRFLRSLRCAALGGGRHPNPGPATTNPNRRSLAALPLTGLLLLLALAPASSLVHAQSLSPSLLEREAAFGALLEKAAAEGPVRVIVTLDVPSRLEGRSTPTKARRQEAAVAAAQDAVISRLRTAGEVKRFRYVAGFAATVGASDLERLRHAPEVASVEVDALHAPFGGPASASLVALSMLDESTALIGAPAVHATGIDGAGSEVAILDTGVDSGHPFLGGRVVAEACFSTNDPSYSATSLCPSGGGTEIGPGAGADCDPSEANGCGHGTHVAGIAAGSQPQSGGPASGVAPAAGIVAVQVFSKFDNTYYCGSEPCLLVFDSDLILALEHVYDLAVNGERPIAAVNLSLGAGGYTAACDDNPKKEAIDNLLSAGVATVIAAGNDGYVDAISEPACISTAVAVGSTTKTDGVSSFSNVAPLMDLFAPGSDITSALVGGGYETYSGTSMAAPHVAGAFTLLRQAFPEETADERLERLVATGVMIEAGAPVASYPRIRLDAIELPPAIASVSIPVDPVPVESDIVVSVEFSDPNAGDVHTCSIAYGDGTMVDRATAGVAPHYTCTGTHAYAEAGIYTVTVTVSDGAHSVMGAAADYVVVYDPSAGFVTGGGWIDSPEGAFPAYPSLTGRASFGFVAKYKRGKSEPDGNTQFQFNAAGLSFHSTAYDWLVIAGPHAKFKGTGTVNGGEGYGFMLTATDGEANGGSGDDLFRIKIWDTEDMVVYDNKMGEGDDSDAGTALGGGQIMIHSQRGGGGNAAARSAEGGVPEVFALASAYPNPFARAATLGFDVPEAADVRLVVYDVLGREVAVLTEGPVEAGRHEAVLDGRSLPSGTYLVRMTADGASGGGFAQTQRVTLMR